MRYHRIIRSLLILILLAPLFSRFTPPAVAAAPLTPLAWRDTPVELAPDNDGLCFLPARSDLVVLTQRGTGTVARNLVTGEHRVLSRHFVLANRDLSCAVNSAGDTFFGWAEGDQTWRFSLDDGEGQLLAHRPTHLAGGDWRSVYSLEYRPTGPSRLADLWASDDYGTSWELRTLPEGAIVQAVAVAPHDSARLYATGLTMSDTGGRCWDQVTPIVEVHVSLYRSTDSGRTWETGALLTTYTGCANDLRSTRIEALHGADGSALVASYSNGIHGSNSGVIELLSTDHGRTFREVGKSGFGAVPVSTSLVNTEPGIVRLYTGWWGPERLQRTADGGATWISLSGPPTYPKCAERSYDSFGRLFATPADPRSLLLTDSGRWYSPDSGATWRQIADPSSYDIYISPFAPLTVLRVKHRRLAILDLQGPGADPLAAVGPPEDALETRYFPETRHQIGPLFSLTWEELGGLESLGPPLSEEFVEQNAADGRSYLVQYFTRARLEYHPVPTATWRPTMMLGLLGNELTAPRRAAGEPAFAPIVDPRRRDVRHFPETGHTLGGAFLRYWERNGQIARLGYPISEPLVETLGGWTGSVQYFERARLELRGDQVWQSDLGAELLAGR